MRIFLVFALMSVFYCTELQAQFSRYIVQLKHKGATNYTLADPLPYLSQRAIDRRTRYGIAMDSTDLPVPVSYIQQLAAIPAPVTQVWLTGGHDPRAIGAISAAVVDWLAALSRRR